MTKAKLEDGTIIQLERDCECITHRNPHWVHSDNFHREQNRKAIEPILPGNLPDQISATFRDWAYALMDWHAKAELIRLREKRQNMERLGIVELIHEPDDEMPVHQPKRQRRKRNPKPEMTFTGDKVLLTNPITNKPIGT